MVQAAYNGGNSQAYHDFRRELIEYDAQSSLTFGVRFQLQKLVDNCYLPANRVRSLAIALQDLSKKTYGKWNISANSLQKLMPNIAHPSPDLDNKMFDVSNILTQLIEQEKKVHTDKWQELDNSSANENMALVHQAIVTPTRITLEGPEWESNNRVLGKYGKKYHDFFMRVRFVDENGESVFFDSRMSQECVYTRYKNVLEQGISVGGKQFAFLGFSHSSLPSQTVWFQAPFVFEGTLHSYRDIIASIGSFAHIRSPAKCAARIGQAFSETPIAIPLDGYKVEVIKIPDVTSGIRVFSDGVGTISAELVDIINSAHLPSNRASETCFQIRFAGAKGMLSMDTREKVAKSV